VSLTGTEKTLLDRRISNYTVFTISIKELTDNLYSNGDAGQFRIRINDSLDWTFDLELNDLRAPEYKATYTTDKGVFEFEEPFAVNTFKGKTSDGQTVRFTIDENTFFGVILGDNCHYVIRPAKDFSQNREDKNYVVYKSNDIIFDKNDFDYIDDALGVPQDYKNGSSRADMTSSLNNTSSSSSCPNYYLYIATDADYEFYQAKDFQTNSSIMSVLNIADGVYQSTFGLNIIVTFQNVYTTSSQPYTSSDAETLLNSFRTQWNTNHTGITRNIAHLFTGKTLNSGILGISYKGNINGNDPNNSAYSMTKYDTNMQYSTVHEIGHNLNASHPTANDCDCNSTIQRSVMCQGYNIANLWFCSQSKNEINPFLSANRALLAGICGDNYIYANSSSFQLINPPTGTIYWTVSDPSIFAVNSSGNPTTVTRVGIGTSGVTLSARIGSVNGTMIASKTITPFTPYISGPDIVCNPGSTFTLNYPPPGTITWSVSSPYMLSNITSNSVTVTAIAGDSNGSLTAKSNGTDICQKRLWSCLPIYSITGPDCVSNSATYYASNSGAIWEVVPSMNFTIKPNSDGRSAIVTVVPGTTGIGGAVLLKVNGYQVAAKPISICNSSSVVGSSISAYPNPASDILTVEIDTEASGSQQRTQTNPAIDVRLYDSYGVQWRQQITKDSKVQFNVSNLPNGLYYLHIYDGINSAPEMRKVVVVKH